ncbi:MAG: hypothetical protein L0027_07595 [Candidatus Rokubacteria bacterium]|nr:hypothetical protein [Candidatus Rokubacteria bacterium]
MATLEVICPCCQARLTVDTDLRAIIAHEAPARPRSGIGLGEALSSLEGEAARREARFKEQLQAEASKRQLLDRKFKEGMKKAKDLPDQLRPIDLD